MNKLNLVNALYKYNEKEVYLKVDYENKDIYLSIDDISLLFDKGTSTIYKAIKSINEKDSNLFFSKVRKVESVKENGKAYKTNIYNSNIIFELGLRYKSEIIMNLKDFISNLFKDNDNVETSNLSLNRANNYDIVKYDNGEIILDVNVSPTEETVWLNQKQIAQLFDTTVDNVSLHIINIYESNELEENRTTEDSSIVQMEGNRKVSRKIVMNSFS